MKYTLIFIFLAPLVAGCFTTNKFRNIPNEELVKISPIHNDTIHSDEVILSGSLTDYDNGDGIIFASVAIFRNSIFIKAVETDFYGNFSFSIRPFDELLDYTMEFGYVGYNKLIVSEFDFRSGTAYDLVLSMYGDGVFINL